MFWQYNLQVRGLHVYNQLSLSHSGDQYRTNYERESLNPQLDAFGPSPLIRFFLPLPLSMLVSVANDVELAALKPQSNFEHQMSASVPERVVSQKFSPDCSRMVIKYHPLPPNLASGPCARTKDVARIAESAARSL